MTDYWVLGSLSFHELFLVGFPGMPVVAQGLRPPPSLMVMRVRVPALYQEIPELPSSGVCGQPGLPAWGHIQSQRPHGDDRLLQARPLQTLLGTAGDTASTPGRAADQEQRCPRMAAPAPRAPSPFLLGRRVCGPDVTAPRGTSDSCSPLERHEVKSRPPEGSGLTGSGRKGN